MCLRILILSILSANIILAQTSLVQKGKVVGAIVLAENAFPGEKLAAQELQHYFAKITGAKVPIQATATGNSLIIATAAANNIPADIREQLFNANQEEAFYLKTQGKNFYLIGKTQVGALYGAYTLLHDYYQVRWFYPGEDGEYLETQENLILPEIDQMEQPVFAYRNATQVSAVGQAEKGKVWAARLKLQSPGAFSLKASLAPEFKEFYEARIASHILSTGGHLTFYLAVPPQKYLESHPEYFALVDGQRQQNSGHHNTHHCLANPEVQELVYQYICNLIEEHGNKVSYLFGAPDSAKGWCECPECRALDGGEQLNISRRFHSVVQKIAARVYARYPEARLSTWAYWNYRSIPEGVSIDPRMMVYFCSHGRCFAHRIDDPQCRRNVEVFTLLKDWLKVNPKLRLYEYAHATPMTTTPLQEVLAADLKTFRKLGICGWKEEIAFPDANYSSIPDFQQNPGHVAYSLRNEWLFWNIAAQLTWNPELDWKEIQDDLLRKYYGLAYPAMQKYHDLKNQNWKYSSGCFGYPHGDSRTPKMLQKTGLKEEFENLLREAESLAGSESRALERVQREKILFEHFLVAQNQHYRSVQSKLLTAPLRQGEIQIDGVPDETAWISAQYTSELVSVYQEKILPPPPQLQTTLGILSDAENLYFLVTAMEPAPDKLQTNAEKDGAVWSDDSCEFFLAPPNNANKYYQIVINSEGTYMDAAQPGNESKLDLGIKVAARVSSDRYVLEMKVPVKNIEGVFAPGMTWNFHFARNRQIKDENPTGSFSLGGEPYHRTSSYRTLAIGNPLLKNGNFNALGEKPGTLENWTIRQGEVISVSDLKNNVKLQPGGSLSQLLWDWQGPLGQSKKARPIEIFFRIQGKGNIRLAFARYHDNWETGKLQRQSFPTEYTNVLLDQDNEVYSLDYTIRANEWIGLEIQTPNGALIQNVSVILH
ncbi:MAG: DUF4838 domain-containing protein [Lentisphaeria bacterium]